MVVTLTGEGRTQRLSFAKAEITIGRVAGNDIVLPKGNVSKQHTRIVEKDGRLIVLDLKSTSGTLVNGTRITAPKILKPADEVQIGDFVLVVGLGSGLPERFSLDSFFANTGALVLLEVTRPSGAARKVATVRVDRVLAHGASPWCDAGTERLVATDMPLERGRFLAVVLPVNMIPGVLLTDAVDVEANEAEVVARVLAEVERRKSIANAE